MTAEDLLWAIGRATLFTSVAAVVAIALLRFLQIMSLRTHRIAWLIVAIQGWLLFPFVWQVETAPVESPEATVSVEPTPFRIADLSTPSTAPADEIAELQQPLAYQRIAIVDWMCGGLLLILWRGVQFSQFVRQLPPDEGVADAAWQREWQRQLRMARIRRPVELRLTRDIGPLLCFVPFRYLVVVPRPLWTRLTRRERSTILRHELAHLVRGDLWWSLAIRFVALPQWFNPLVWLAVRRFDEAGEWACDDWASRGRRGRELAFASSLLKTVEFAKAGPPGTVSMRGGELARRIRRLVTRPFKEEVMIKKLMPLLALGAIVVAQLVRIERVSAEAPVPSAAADAKPAPTPARAIPPSYVIEPPDILMIKAIKLIPKAPHRIEPFDSLLVRVLGALPDQPVADTFAVDPDGKIDLGPTYGRVEVAGQTVDEARETIARELAKVLTSPQVSVSLAASAGAQQIQGEHLVGPDGRVNFGVYGTVYLTGLTIEEARKAIEHKLSEYLENPQVVVEIFAFNSKKYYVITRTAGHGDYVTSVSLTGNDRVLDALSKVGRLPEDSSNKIWISRPAPNGSGLDTILPVRWDDISAGKSTSTNYELLPGDRLFIVGGQPSSDASVPRADFQLPPNKFLYSPYADMEVQSTPARMSGSADRVEFSIDILEDRAQALAEYDVKRGEAPFLAVDAETIRPALRALTGYGHIRMLSSPKLACRLGETATIELKPDGKKGSPGENLKLSISPHRKDGRVFVKLQFESNREGKKSNVDVGVPMEAGQTVLIPVPSRLNDGKWGEPLYLALSRSSFGSELPASQEATYYRFSVPPTAE